MYLDSSSIEEASGLYPIDDDDYSSASGSGKSACWMPLYPGMHTLRCAFCQDKHSVCHSHELGLGVQIPVLCNLSYENFGI